jgi:hypothetical protein
MSALLESRGKGGPGPAAQQPYDRSVPRAVDEAGRGTPGADWFDLAVMHHTDCGSGVVRRRRARSEVPVIATVIAVTM